jgi:hypothetical protein
MRARAQSLAVLLALLATQGASASEDSSRSAPPGCPVLRVTPAHERAVEHALRARADVWGNALLRTRGGPTYAGVHQYASPLLFARTAHGKALTESGVYYVPFMQPSESGANVAVALHLADGSQIISNRVGGPRLTIGVGGGGSERFGACLARAASPRLLGGHLPMLETSCVDSFGVRYRQESFATRVPGTSSLVSFVRLTADARRARGDATIRFTPSEAGLNADRTRVGRGDETRVVFNPGGVVDGSSVTYPLPSRTVATVYAAWLHTLRDPLELDQARYDAARAAVVRYWTGRLSGAMQVVVPDRHVLDAERAALIQDLELTWRYSVGNPYQEFSYPEGIDVAEVMSAYGLSDVARSILVKSLGQRPTRFPNWQMGQKLVGVALYYRLIRDRAFVDEATPVLRRYVVDLSRQIRSTRSGILQRERYSSDIPARVYGLHSQAIVWEGLQGMARVWREVGRASLAARCAALARRLEAGLRWAIRTSEVHLPDGSRFVDARLLDHVRPYNRLTASRYGSYWNLVMPYALASGLFAPGSADASGLLRYLLAHGSRLLGLVRTGAFALYGKTPEFPESGVNPVYGLNAARFLADNHQSDQLVLSLYGYLALAMAPGTFVSGEAVSVAPLGDAYHRATYLPPNGASSASFLETLRLMLVHETRDRNGTPRGLELAFSTPRAWLRPGRRIAVRDAPTSFGPLSYAIESRRARVLVAFEAPARRKLQRLRLRLRLPGGQQVSGVVLDGRPFHRFDRGSATIDLTGLAGHNELVARLTRTRAPRPRPSGDPAGTRAP